MAKLNIDFSKVEAAQAFSVLPTGWQRAIMTESETKPTANNATTGNERISTRFKIIDGPYMNQVLFKDFNSKNQNEQAQSIGWGEMKALNDALGLIQPEDTQEWHNKPVLIHVKLKPARTVVDPAGGPSKEYDAQNDINGFKNVNDTSVEVNHNTKMNSGGANVTVAAGFANGGSPVPAVGVQAAAPSGLAAVMAAANPAAAAAPAAPTAPAAPAAPVAPVVKVEPVFALQMTEKAQGMTKEQFVAADPAWISDDLLIQHGYAVKVEVKPAAPLAPTAPTAPSAPAAPAAPATPQTPAVAQASAAGNGAAVPPWLAGK